MKHRCFVGLGSNLDDPVKQIERALQALARLPDSRLGTISPRYRSHAIGPGEQPDYVNAVAELHTPLEPLALLEALQAIESQHGRQRHIRWGARTLDLDLLLYSDLQHHCERLTVPHPRLRERAFVLVPLFDIAPQLKLPNGTSLASLLDYVGKDTLWPLGD